jgi:hypothetical protein
MKQEGKLLQKACLRPDLASGASNEGAAVEGDAALRGLLRANPVGGYQGHLQHNHGTLSTVSTQQPKFAHA